MPRAKASEAAICHNADEVDLVLVCVSLFSVGGNGKLTMRTLLTPILESCWTSVLNLVKLPPAEVSAANFLEKHIRI